MFAGWSNSFISSIEHVLNMLGLVLRSVLMDLLFVRKLNRSSSVEELGSAVSRHVLELAVVENIRSTLTIAY